MARLERRLSDWRVLIDGVEVPHTGFTITFGRNLYANGQVFLEPDVVVMDFRPNSLIQFFFRDTTETSNNELDQYKLYMEVESIGPTHNKTPQSRSMGIGFAGLFRVFARHKLFMSSVGDQFQTTHITGGYALPQMAASILDTGDPFSVLALAGYFDANRPTNGDKKEAPFRASKDENFAERMLPFIAYLASFNASQRLQVVRTRLMNKIAAVPDSTLGGMIPATLSNVVFQQMHGEVNADDSYLDLINRFCRQVFYSWYQLPAPYTPTGRGGDKGNKIAIPDSKTGVPKSVDPQPEPGGEILNMPQFLNKDLRVFSFIQDYYRNDYLFAPELFYAMPPPCNFIMPEDIDQLSYQRVFDSEPTRVILNEPYFTANKAAYFSPVTLLRSVSEDDRLKISAAEFFGTNVGALSNASPSGKPTSPYDAPQHTSSSPLGRINLLSVLDENEIEKGIICRRDFNPFELFTAVGKLFENERTVDQAFAGAAGRVERLNEGEANDYEKIMTRLADYRYQQGIAERNASVSCRGLRWAVPGFSTIVFDKDASYFGFIENMTFGVDAATGSETTNLQLSKVRVIPTISKKEAERLESRFEAHREGLTRRYANVEKRFNERIEAIEKAYWVVIFALQDMNKFIEDASDLAVYDVRGVTGFGQSLGRVATKLKTGVATLPESIVSPLQAAADDMNKYASPVRRSLFTIGRTESARRFAAQNAVPPNGANLKSPVVVRGTKVVDAFQGTRLVKEAVDVTYTRTQREQYVNGDYEEYIRGYLPLFKDGQLGTSVFEIALSGLNTYNTREIIIVIREQASALRQQTKDYLQFQIKELQAAINNNMKPDIDTLGIAQIKEDVSAAETSEEYIRSFFSELTGFLLPPTWFNRGLLTAESLDMVYGSLLGCQPFYGPDTEFGRGFTGAKPGEEITSKELYDEYTNLLQILDRLFPIIRSGTGLQPKRTGQTEYNPEGTTKWDTLVSGPELDPGPGPWIERNIQRRQATSLRKFLEQHGLELRKELSDIPTSEEFWIFVPKDEGDENTIYDFIVDEWEMFPTLMTYITSPSLEQITGGLLEELPPMVPRHGGDPQVQQLRQQMKESDHPTAKYLFREARQKIIIDYSKRHFGSRAFDGR